MVVPTKNQPLVLVSKKKKKKNPVAVVVSKIFGTTILVTQVLLTASHSFRRTLPLAAVVVPDANSNNNNNLYAFTLRDSVRLSANPLPRGLHIYDFVDVYTMQQAQAKRPGLFVDGREVQDYKVPCWEYSGACYRKKLMDVMELALERSHGSSHLFYMESDNELCISIDELATMANQYKRYFIATGVGASGWIMSRQFVDDFLQEYKKAPSEDDEERPDVIASSLLQRNSTWSVTRQYYVSHTVLPSMGKRSMNGFDTQLKKHLPRCFEPHRGLWGIRNQKNVDQFGWDYFDYSDERCTESDIYPC